MIERYRVFIWSIIGVVVFFVFYAQVLNILSGEKGRLRKFILKGKQAVESKNIFTCANMISKDYHDKYGNDRQSLIYATKEAFGYYSKISVHIDNMDIQLSDSKDEASVEIVALVVGQTQQDNAEKILEGEKGRFRVKLIKEEKVWKVLELEFFEPITIMGQNIS